MNHPNMFTKLIEMIRSDSLSLKERLFVLLTILSEIAVFIAFIGDLLMGENIYEVLVLSGTLVLVPIITFTSLFHGHLDIGIRLIILGLVFLIMPAIYFFGGGMYGGGYLWFIFTFMYIGMVLSGRWRNFMLVVVILEAMVCYYIEYHYPRLVAPHERSMGMVDNLISLVLVGGVCFAMSWFQRSLLQEESARARAAQEEAEELTRSQSRFFSSMSHEIRTPINSILGLNELILREENTSEEVARDAAGIQGAGKMLLALINDILDFSKIEAGSMDIVPVDYKVGNLLSEVVNMIWLRAQDKGLKFNVSIDPNVPSVLYGDEVRIKQILINLLNNAVKYTKEGSIGLHMESEPTEEGACLLRISVTDTGMGIKKEVIPDLFDAFKRVDEKRNRNIEGTGLGLSIVKQLVDLMEGTITVDSVYGTGSTFNVTMKQGVSDASTVGELSIHNYGKAGTHSYESSFTAPEAKVLIVDDNEMNLEVEQKLLSGTLLQVDTVMSGREALDISLRNRYDCILMDHLMPGMDGIQCMEALRRQSGGLNQTTPIIVLTANAGSENRDLYNRSGFDGYLVKPVSGNALESMLVKFLPRDKVNIRTGLMRMRQDINAAEGYARKIPVAISTTSMCDLPDAVIRKLNLPILPFLIRTDEGVFKDGIQMGHDELIRYMNSGRNAASAPPGVADYTTFFSNVLKNAHHLIHISITSSMSEDHYQASAAAEAFENVTVVNSECVSSATGLLVLIAYKLSQQDLTVEEIVSELEQVKKRIHCSFVIKSTDYMAEKGLISHRIQRVSSALEMHPGLMFRNDTYKVGGVWFGSLKHAYKRYIHRVFPADIIPDSEVLFITYADVPEEDLSWIREEISRVAYFERVVFVPASAAISSNCGPGAFGLLYFVKGNKSYNIGSLLPEEQDGSLLSENRGESGEDRTSGPEAPFMESSAKEAEELPEEKPVSWYDRIEGLDSAVAIKNSGSVSGFETVLKMFYESMDEKIREIRTCFEEEDWNTYTIKVHALKSASRLVGILGLSKQAEDLEMAGKSEDLDFIREHHDRMMKTFLSYKAPLEEKFGPLLSGEEASDSSPASTPEEAAEDEGTEVFTGGGIVGGGEKMTADAYLMDCVYEAVRDAARAEDMDTIKETMREMEDYEIPAEEWEKYGKLMMLVSAKNYEEILWLLGEQ